MSNNSNNRTTLPEKKQLVTADNELSGAIKPKPCLRQVTVFDVQWSDCPQFVEEEVVRLWTDNELGNDVYFHKWSPAAWDDDEYPVIKKFLLDRGVEPGTEVWIHWWW